MSEDKGEKTEEPTQKKIDDAHERGQFAKSAEVQSAFVLTAGALALLFSAGGSMDALSLGMRSVYTNLHHADITVPNVHRTMLSFGGIIAKCILPVVLPCLFAGLLAGGMQSGFKITAEAFGIKFERLNPIEGLKKVFTFKQIIPTMLGALKLAVIVALTYGVIKQIINDPIFYSPINAERIAVFLADSAWKILIRVCAFMVVVALLDYLYQKWKTKKSLMMSKQEMKDESKNTDGNPEHKAMRKRIRAGKSVRQMIEDVPTADAIITNPTHISVAVRYDRKSMDAPIIVAKGSNRLALRIREAAKAHGIPIIENKPLARLMFKYGKVDGEIPAELYSAVAEILAHVYRVNAYRYYRQGTNA